MLLLAGDTWLDRRAKLNNKSFQSCYGGVEVRISETVSEFVNDLYRPGSRAIVSWNREKGSITVSVPEPIKGFSCREFVQSLGWIDEQGTSINSSLAGGHDGIAGSPRGYRFKYEIALDIQDILSKKFAGVPEAVLA